MPTQEMFDSLSGVLEPEVMGCVASPKPKATGCVAPPSTCLERRAMERDVAGNHSARFVGEVASEIGEVVSRGAAAGISAVGTTVASGVCLDSRALKAST